MKLQEWIAALPENSRLTIFGFADVGKHLAAALHAVRTDMVIDFCDNNSTRQGMQPEGLVLSVKDAAGELSGNHFYAIASLWHDKQMRKQLLSLGVPETAIMDALPDEILQEEHQREVHSRTTKKTSYHIECNIDKHCNLNCKGCDHFAPVAEQEFLSLTAFARDMKEIQRLYADKEGGEFHLLGGEPTLHPDIIEFIRITREALPQAKLVVDTNGTLLRRMPESFYAACRQYDVTISVTRYPIKLDYDALGKWIRAQGVVYEYLGSSEGGRTLWKFPLDFTGSQDPSEMFRLCRNANTCWTLEKGRLYTCSIGPNMPVFEQRFHKGIKLTDADGIDIYKAKDADEIAAYLAHPMPCCRYCDVKHRTYDHAWEVSSQSINEWS